MSEDPIRIDALESELAELKKKVDRPKPKDRWDKLSALSTVVSGVLIAGMGFVLAHEPLIASQTSQVRKCLTGTKEAFSVLAREPRAVASKRHCRRRRIGMTRRRQDAEAMSGALCAG